MNLGYYVPTGDGAHRPMTQKSHYAKTRFLHFPHVPTGDGPHRLMTTIQTSLEMQTRPPARPSAQPPRPRDRRQAGKPQDNGDNDTDDQEENTTK